MYIMKTDGQAWEEGEDTEKQMKSKLYGNNQRNNTGISFY